MPTRAGRRSTPQRVLRYDDVVAGARRHFLACGGLHLDELAGELAIGRATLYRLIDGRDRLLGDVIWSLAGPLLDGIVARRLADPPGADPTDLIIAISLDFYEEILAPSAFRTFLQEDQETAMRVLFTPAGGVHERAVEAQRGIFGAVQQRVGGTLPEDLDGLAYLYVRIVESLLYADLFADRAPDLALVERAARAILAAE
jgi:hypothetical protein